MNQILMIMYLTQLISMQDKGHTKKTMMTSLFITIEIKKQKYAMIFGMSFIWPKTLCTISNFNIYAIDKISLNMCLMKLTIHLYIHMNLKNMYKKKN